MIQIVIVGRLWQGVFWAVWFLCEVGGGECGARVGYVGFFARRGSGSQGRLGNHLTNHFVSLFFFSFTPKNLHFQFLLFFLFSWTFYFYFTSCTFNYYYYLSHLVSEVFIFVYFCNFFFFLQFFLCSFFSFHSRPKTTSTSTPHSLHIHAPHISPSPSSIFSRFFRALGLWFLVNSSVFNFCFSHHFFSIKTLLHSPLFPGAW